MFNVNKIINFRFFFKDTSGQQIILIRTILGKIKIILVKVSYEF